MPSANNHGTSQLCAACPLLRHVLEAVGSCAAARCSVGYFDSKAAAVFAKQPHAADGASHACWPLHAMASLRLSTKKRTSALKVSFCGETPRSLPHPSQRLALFSDARLMFVHDMARLAK